MAGVALVPLKSGDFTNFIPPKLRVLYGVDTYLIEKKNQNNKKRCIFINKLKLYISLK